ncbi:MAG: CocE/NonD family hydrolase [Acidobacteriota bacterium]
MKRATWMAVAGVACCVMSVVAGAQQAKKPADDLTPNFKVPEVKVEKDYDKRVVMIPMRDGVKLYTVIVVPKGAKDAPMVMTRTCYNAAGRAARSESVKMIEALPLSDEDFVRNGYIRVYQDVRGKYGSEGVYLMTPPPLAGGYNPSGADDTTDAYDTIDWLVKNVPESNGRVGMIGSSYEGLTVVMALLHPHPALKVAAPESPMVDGWMGDDWFHYGAFRQPNLDYILGQTTKRAGGFHVPRKTGDDYTNFLEAGSAGDFARAEGMDQLPYWHTMEEHPAYDGFWQSQALDKLIAKTKLTVPTMWEQGEWDQEDMWGANHSYRAWEPQDKNNNMNYLVMGPWFHSQINRQGKGLGPFAWNGDTSEYWRGKVLVPFFNQYLKPGAPVAKTPPVLMYDAGLDQWDRMEAFPRSCESGCAAEARPLYLRAEGKLSWDAPKGEGAKFDEYVSDPAKPVPYRPRPVDPADGTGWRTWLVTDQRFVDGRPDVLTYETEALTEPMKLSGEVMVHLVASTTGTDSDWVVKLIDVYPSGTADKGDTGGVFAGVLGTPVNMSGYELPIGIDIFRGRYRESFEHPEAIAAGKPLEYKFALPMVERTILPGHRLMVQVQSTLFPLYDRNPQTFVTNIFDAKPGEYQKATQKVWHEAGEASYVSLPVVAEGSGR